MPANHDDLAEVLPVPQELRHHHVEVIFISLDSKIDEALHTTLKPNLASLPT